ncbi:hypothetical protein PV325_001751 [Microctonus aethiopoides]|nr:hypothetical protein PV325_001751 [Microctonus aethiopoides]
MHSYIHQAQSSLVVPLSSKYCYSLCLNIGRDAPLFPLGENAKNKPHHGTLEHLEWIMWIGASWSTAWRIVSSTSDTMLLISRVAGDEVNTDSTIFKITKFINKRIQQSFWSPINNGEQDTVLRRIINVGYDKFRLIKNVIQRSTQHQSFQILVYCGYMLYVKDDDVADVMSEVEASQFDASK